MTIGDDLPSDYSSKPRLDPDEARAARVTVALNSLDAADCHDLLDKLGLLPKGVET